MGGFQGPYLYQGSLISGTPLVHVELLDTGVPRSQETATFPRTIIGP